MTSDTLILVDEHDRPIGEEEKLRAHELGLLHRAFSILVFNSRGELMLQQRALGKYHCGGLWTNTCCSHPRPGETTLAAALRRLQEEMGFDCELEEALEFIYKVDFPNGLTEHEYLHIFIGHYDKDPVINPEEAADFRWISIEALRKDIADDPEKYTYWFRLALDKLISRGLLPKR
ncbi:MAG: isopentenyl-diphosphate delta-isomerase [Candidatus Moranbacteria bacterium RIFCSPHIGHO2_12_FULL_54_9]|nr:MAG: isopentenyl-diphosphate delta-isomerase [Candidatus Moranbacteria bacterium RIFCSPHIGHO2_01_FULL_54_31]OGI25272.1 MAG: isopentenyl-diphosphate delta-isomerase [Candidatus Moranbacteria bacterium RIFCSPHIGHO2_12_FULL_54_9]